MKHFITFAFMILVCTGFMFSAVDDGPWNLRHTSSGAKKAYLYYKNIYENNPSYEASWKFSRAAFHYADIFVNDKSLKKVVFTEGKLAGEKATVQKPQGVEGHMYLGICLGSWAKANGIFSSLRTVPVIFNEANKAIGINESFAEGGSLLLRGNVYMKAPGSKGGDINKAEADFKKVITMFPNNRKAYGYLAEALIKQKKNSEAKAIINKGLAISYDSADKSAEDQQISKLKQLKSQVD